ncbi:hypothetical protein JTE90_010900 [Oedothorax gibbosus]|uniref:Uncharacterized protein n=1 Tax=Oedothorax gibbosus TaxID=931172 RepID=A0AAV6UFZ1_9ARAC|nr:hypothetical protein JTE90_010900 [Oedothorax gibbosus]
MYICGGMDNVCLWRNGQCMSVEEWIVYVGGGMDNITRKSEMIRDNERIMLDDPGNDYDDSYLHRGNDCPMSAAKG